ncbi:hypothetical protein ABZV78_23370 [Micromonospora sp. NPDC004540]|uniref:hypothetical protein n=1 Tax=Micromonospora sp. NPDC004540 TaxID=3154457 RepID=UPI0033B1AE81
MRRWRRADPWTTRRQVPAGVAILYGSLALLVLSAGMVTELVAGRLAADQAGSMAVAIAVIVGVLLVAVRFHLVGVYHGERGLLIRNVLFSRLLPWREVTGFYPGPTVLSGPGLEGRQWTLCVLTRDGAVETPVQSRGPVLMRQLESLTGPALPAAEFDLVVLRLREAHAAAQSDGGVVVR